MLKGREIVLVEDDDLMGESLLQRLELEGASVHWFKLTRRAIGAIRTPRKPVDVVICDISLPDGSGEDLYTTLCRTGAPPPFLFVTEQGSVDQAVRLLKSGASDYLVKPFDMALLLERLVQLVSPREQLGYPPLIGISPAARRVEEMIVRAAATDHNVLIAGGPGKGKNVIARRVHDLSDRRANSFVTINLAREVDAEQALFGDGAGINALNEGTLYINAVDRLPVAVQDRLLRVLDTGFDCRVISACADDLDALVAEGAFRAELLYRLAHTMIRVPPLSERPDDAVWLLQQLYLKLAPRYAPGLHGISLLCEEAVRSHAWSGGGREVRARLVRGLTMATGSLLQPADMFPESFVKTEQISTLAEARDVAEKAHILLALQQTGGQTGETAKVLGVSRTTLWAKMQKFDLS